MSPYRAPVDRSKIELWFILSKFSQNENVRSNHHEIINTFLNNVNIMHWKYWTIYLGKKADSIHVQSLGSVDWDEGATVNLFWKAQCDHRNYV